MIAPRDGSWTKLTLVEPSLNSATVSASAENPSSQFSVSSAAITRWLNTRAAARPVRVSTYRALRTGAGPP